MPLFRKPTSTPHNDHPLQHPVACCLVSGTGAALPPPPRRYLEAGELEHHDRMTTAGLAVACLRAGEEASALEMLDAAVKPYSSTADADTPSADSINGIEEDEDEEGEEEDWEALEAEEELEDILEAEGEVLPELLDYYLERGQKESSQEAAIGVRLGLRLRCMFSGFFGSLRFGFVSGIWVYNSSCMLP